MRDLKFALHPESKKLDLVNPARRLIISSGDISDIDGFLALAEYSKVVSRVAYTVVKSVGPISINCTGE